MYYVSYVPYGNGERGCLYDLPYTPGPTSRLNTGAIYPIMHYPGGCELPYYCKHKHVARNVYPELGRQLMPRLYRDLAPDVRISTMSMLTVRTNRR
jgi:hypothetical protein